MRSPVELLSLCYKASRTDPSAQEMTHYYTCSPVAQPMYPVYTTYAPVQQCAMSRHEIEYERRRQARHAREEAECCCCGVLLASLCCCFIH